MVPSVDYNPRGLFDASTGSSADILINWLTGERQVWSLTQFYSVDFSQSRIGVEKCVFNKQVRMSLDDVLVQVPEGVLVSL